MESKQRNARWSAWVGSLAVALLLFGGTAAYADSRICYECTSYCTQVGVMYGFTYKNPDGTVVKIGGKPGGFAACAPSTPGSAKDNCFRAVQARCAQMCTDCLNGGGHMGGPGGPVTYTLCSDAACSNGTGVNAWGEATSVCAGFCICAAGKSCLDTLLPFGGLLSTMNSACLCP